MRRTLTLEIEAGETTCFAEPGKPCPFVRASHFGTVWNCALFEGALLRAEPHPFGWLQRLPECLAAEVKP